MTLLYSDPADISYPTPYFQDNTFVRGDYMRSNNQKIWGNSQDLDDRITAYEIPADISGGTVHDITRHGQTHGIGVTNEPADKYFWGTDYITPITTGREYPTASVINNKIYVVGGGTLTTNQEYDRSTNSWATKTPMTVGRGQLSSAIYNGKLYAIGGNTGGTSSSNANEEYDPVGNSWTTKTAMTTARYGLISETIGSKIYSIGGTTSGADALTTNEEYDPVGNSWTTKTAMTTGRRYVSSAVYNGEIYVIGGISGSGISAVVESYNPASNTWTTRGSLNVARYRASACAINGKLYVFSGTSASLTYETSVEEYNPGTDTWTNVTSMIESRGFMSPTVPVIGSTAYLISGSIAGSSGVTNTSYISIVNDWNYEYIQKNASTLQVIATDAFGSWRGNAVKVANNIDTTAVWSGWTYTNKSALQWYDFTLLNGWTTTDIAKFSKDENGWVTVVMNNMVAGSAITVAILPIGYRPSIRHVDGGYLSGTTNVYIQILPTGEVNMNNVGTQYGQITFKAEQ